MKTSKHIQLSGNMQTRSSAMQLENKRHRTWQRWMGVLGVFVAVVCCVGLVNGVTAFTGNGVLQKSVTEESAVYAKPAGGTEGAWVQVDGDAGTPVTSSDTLRLRIAFSLPADSLKEDSELTMTLPDCLDVDKTAGRVFSNDAGQAASAIESGGTSIGTAKVDGSTLTVTFDDNTVAQNVSKAAETKSSSSSSSSAATEQADESHAGEAVEGFVDIDFAPARLTAAADQTATLQLSDDVTLVVLMDNDEATYTSAESSSVAAPLNSAASTVSSQEEATSDTDGEEASAESPENSSTASTSLGIIVQTPGSSSTAEFLSNDSVSAKRMTASTIRREAAANDTASNDLSQYLTSGTSVMKLENGVWVPTTEVKEGDKIKVNLAYNFPAGVVTKDNRTFTCTVPEGVRPNEAQSGPVTNAAGTEVGTYTIGTDGTMTITFDESAATGGGAVVGSTTWQGTASLGEGKDSGNVHFGGAAADVTITKPEQEDTQYDVHTEKTGTLSSDHTTADYVVTVSTTKGTGDPVTFSDRIQLGDSTNTSPTYDRSSLVIYKKDASGNTTTVTGYTPQWTDAKDGNGEMLDVSNLPALSARESYEVHYKVNTNVTQGAEVGKVANSAGATTPKHNDWSWNQESWEKNIQKTGSYNKETGQIFWRIKVNTNGTDVNGTRVYDSLPDGLTLQGGYTVFSEDQSYIKQVASDGSVVDYTFSNVPDNDKNKVFYIDFYTNAPEGDSTVKNTAQEWHGNNGYSTTGEIGVPVEHRTTDVVKKYKADTITGRDHKLTWDVDVTLPDSAMTTFTFTDTINNATGPNNEDMGKGTHYAIAYELENYLKHHESGASDGSDGHLKIKINDYDYYIYGGIGQTAYENYNNGGAKTTHDMTIVVTYYDLNGNVIDVNSNPNAKVSKFTVTVTPATGFSKKGTHLTITDYPTHVDATNATGGTTWNASNTGDIDGHTSTASHDIPNPKSLDKSANTGGTTWVSDNASVSYDANSGTIDYRVLLETTKDGTITVVDTMPSGMTYVADSVYARFYVNDNAEHDSNWKAADQGGVDFNNAQKPEVSVVNNADGTSTVTFTIKDFHYTDTMPMVALHYKVSVKDDSVWSNPATSEKNYKNNVTWEGHSDDNHTKVTRDVKKVDKSGVQLDKDGNAVQLDSDRNPTGTPVNKLRYYVDINLGAQDLDKNSNVLTLVDQLSDVGKYSPALDLSSVHLYAFNADAEHHLGAEIDASRYSVQFDANSGKMTVKVPDALACVLVYDYEINPNAVASGNTVTNTCSLNGNWSSQTSTVLKESSSSSTAYKAKFEIDKVDGDIFRMLLPGAVFSLDMWDKDQNKWVSVSTNEAVGSDGKLTWDLAGADKDKLTTDRLYRLIETTAPDGYKKDETPHYFIWMSPTTTKNDDAWNNANGSQATKPGSNGKVQQTDVSFFKNSGGIMYIPNTYSRVTVNKTWANSDGTPTSAPSGASVKVGLYRYTQVTNADNSCNVSVVGIGAGTNQWNHPETRDTKVIEKNSSIKVYVDGWNQSFNVYIGGSVTNGLFDDSNNRGTQFGDTFSTVNGSYELTIPASYFSGDNQTVAVQLVGTENAANVRISEYTAGSMVLSDATRAKVGEATLNAGNNWTYNWDNLDATDKDGNKYFYRVEEENAGAYDVSYTNNEGIQTGIITVTNSTQGYNLPKTGGAGSHGPIIAGVCIAAAAGAGLWLRHHMRRRRGF